MISISVDLERRDAEMNVCIAGITIEVSDNMVIDIES